MTISIMITTRNRAADLRRTLQVLRALNPAPLEILITTDGCTDETLEILKAEMKASGSQQSAVSGQWSASGILRLIVNETGRGSVASRDRMLREARGDLVLSLDDDSYPEQPDCLPRLSAIFKTCPNVAIATFPQRTDEYPATLTQTDFGPERAVRSFASSGAVLHRSVYLELPGFVPEFFHAYEEPDYALQCVAAGYEVRFTPVVTIRHHYSGQNRNEIKIHQRHARNECWSTVMRCPLPPLPLLVLYRVGAQFRYACSRGLSWVIREPLWWWPALKGLPACWKKRRPVSWSGYRRWLNLKN